MVRKSDEPRMAAKLDEVDRKILRILQRDATMPLERIAKKVAVSKTAVWNRIQRLQREKVILKQAAILDSERIGLAETFFVVVKTSEHDIDWLNKFNQVVQEMPEITEAHRMAGDMDYLLKVQISSTREFDDFYKRLVSKITVYSVTSSLSMEALKLETSLPI